MKPFQINLEKNGRPDEIVTEYKHTTMLIARGAVEKHENLLFLNWSVYKNVLKPYNVPPETAQHHTR